MHITVGDVTYTNARGLRFKHAISHTKVPQVILPRDHCDLQITWGTLVWEMARLNLRPRAFVYVTSPTVICICGHGCTPLLLVTNAQQSLQCDKRELMQHSKKHWTTFSFHGVHAQLHKYGRYNKVALIPFLQVLYIFLLLPPALLSRDLQTQ